MSTSTESGPESRTTADVIVLGVGPGGEQVVGDLLAAGKSVIAIEAQLVGGECPYWGCIPSKIALRAATTLAEGRRIDALAGRADVTPDWETVAQRIRSDATDDWDDAVAAARITENGGTLVRGFGTVTSDRTVSVDGTTYTATEALVVATGSQAAIPPIDGLAEIPYWTNREALKTPVVPRSMVVLGGGAIGCELAQVFARFDCAVTLVEFAPRLLALEEPEVGPVIAAALTDDGVDVRVGVAATAITAGAPISVTLSDGSTATGDVVLVATGRKVDLAAIGADAIGAGPEHGHVRSIPTDDFMRVVAPNGSPVAGVFAIGDVAGKGAFTHVATSQGRMVADQILGRPTLPFSRRAVGHATFTDPEVGSVGLTEQQARDAGLDVVTAQYPMERVSRGFIHGPGNAGLIKLVVDTDAGTVVGATVVGPHGGEVLGALTVAVAGKVPVANLVTTVWAFPTYHRGIDAVLGELPPELRPIR